MAASQGHAVFMLWLLLSSLGPCEARRVSANLHAKDHGGKESGRDECPEGLTSSDGAVAGVGPNVGERMSQTEMVQPPEETVCYSQRFEKSVASDMWSTTGSDAPLVFLPHGGVYMVESQFLAELAVAFTDERMKLKVATFLALEQMKRNSSFAGMYKAQTVKEHTRLHHVEENLQPGVFVLEHTAEHLLIEGLAVGFHALEHAAAHGTVIGGATLEVVAGFAGEALSFVVAEVLPILLPVQAGFMIWQFRTHLKEQTHHAKDFTSRMVFKSDCMIKKLQSQVVSRDLTLKADISELCTADVATALETQIQQTTAAKIEVFKQIASIGRCLWPHGERAWAKTGCVEAVYFNLLQHEGKSGILYSALTLMAYYGYRVDELLEAPYYRQWYQEEFGIENHVTGISLLPEMLKVKDKPLVDRLPVCMQLMATHHAFERTFVRVKDAIRVWTQSFSRDYWKSSIRTSWWPCQKVFFKMEDFDKGMCKDEDFDVGHGEEEHAIDEHQACLKAKEYSGSLWPEVDEQEAGTGDEVEAQEPETGDRDSEIAQAHDATSGSHTL